MRVVAFAHGVTGSCITGCQIPNREIRTENKELTNQISAHKRSVSSLGFSFSVILHAAPGTIPILTHASSADRRLSSCRIALNNRFLVRPFFAMTGSAEMPEGAAAPADQGVPLANGAAPQIARGASDAVSSLVSGARIAKRIKLVCPQGLNDCTKASVLRYH